MYKRQANAEEASAIAVESLNAQESALIKILASFPEEIIRSAQDYDVSRMTKYAVELASAFHSFYNECRVKCEDEALMQFRVCLILSLIHISVLVSIVSNAANECFGVAGMTAKNVTEGFLGLFRKDSHDKGCLLYTSTALQEQFFRLHIRANSDAEADQRLKLCVRDAVLDYITPYTQDFTSKQQAISFVQEHLEERCV